MTKFFSNRLFPLSALALCLILLSSCANPEENNEPGMEGISCIEKIMAVDDSLGRVRNHLSEMLPLHETIEHYVESSKIYLDFGNCPGNFEKAFKRHWQAWSEMAQVTKDYSELRGEMHSVMDEVSIKCDCKEFNNAMEEIWDSWAVVEELSEKYLDGLE